MAILKNEIGLEVEIQFSNYNLEWVEYSFRFSFAGELIFNPKICDESFFANDAESDLLIPVLKKALNENENKRWEPMEPDLFLDITFCPKLGWIEAQKDTSCVYRSPEYIEQLKVVDELREKSGGKLPDDEYRLVFTVDSCQFNNKVSRGYSGDGPSLVMTVQREQLEEFIKKLEQEYTKFKKEKIKKAL